MKRPLIVPDHLHRNAPDVHARGPEHTGSTLMSLVVERLGLVDLAKSDVLDVGCGVRFTQAIVNCDIPIGSYTGVDVYRPLIEYLQREVDDPRFRFLHWDAQNDRYNPEGVKLTPESRLPIRGDFDIIWLFSVFTHLYPDDASALLSILRQHVRPNGALFFSAFVDDVVARFEDRIPEDPLAYPCYSKSYMEQLIVGAGWTVSYVGPPSHEHFIQHYFVCRPAGASGGEKRNWQTAETW